MPVRVRTRRQFARFSSPTNRGQSGPLRVVFVADDTESSVAVAYAISRRVGNAVIRNRIRRRLRAAIDHFVPQPQPGMYLVKCGFDTGKLTYEQLQHHLRQALERAGGLERF